uniref:Transmembrane protein n=1 Tax=Trypanosoma vivax (strain Y486) TaxID=1055687 RepID=G0U9J1_TRYVY|nr:hypothetical protein, unlikely [Trypanosoma vivax Y486]
MASSRHPINRTSNHHNIVSVEHLVLPSFCFALLFLFLFDFILFSVRRTPIRSKTVPVITVKWSYPLFIVPIRYSDADLLWREKGDKETHQMPVTPQSTNALIP